MYDSDDLENMIYRCIERWSASRYTERHGLVTSYDPKTYLAKVAFQPEGHESGWLPVETGHIGNGYGIAIGLQTGSGQGNQQQNSQGGQQSNNQGDQVIVRYQEGDFESGKIVQRVHSDQDKPPQVQSGEIVIWTQFPGNQQNQGSQSQQTGNQQIWLKKDGTITITDGFGASLKFNGKNKGITIDDGGGGTITLDGKGNITAKSTNNTIRLDANKSLTIDSDNSVTTNAPSIIDWSNGGSTGPYNSGD